ncbi:MAG: acetoacetate decarboxylase family protein [Myxococcales bacterium]|nr:acetoacetate decarboxylase family protein [Myxococcales bacterium]MCB9716269.1 acetoacetate decarboxylase family protein [Myxococcales bacterium]
MTIQALGPSVPFHAPLYASPPCRYTNSELQLVSMVAAPEAVAALVPEPVVPNPDGQLVLMLNRLDADVFGRYHEAALLVPSSFEGVEGNFTAFMYLDEDRPNAAGREIWGWPKKHAMVDIEGDARIDSEVARAGASIIQSRVDLSAELGPAEVALNPTFFNLKLIPSVREGAPPDVMQITATTLQDVVIHRARGGTASVTLRSSKQDPLRRLSPREVQGAVCLQLDLTLGFGEVLHDYLRAG